MEERETQIVTSSRRKKGYLQVGGNLAVGRSSNGILAISSAGLNCRPNGSAPGPAGLDCRPDGSVPGPAGPDCRPKVLETAEWFGRTPISCSGTWFGAALDFPAWGRTVRPGRIINIKTVITFASEVRFR
jgi:hypothetical protein